MAGGPTWIPESGASHASTLEVEGRVIVYDMRQDAVPPPSSEERLAEHGSEARFTILLIYRPLKFVLKQVNGVNIR